MLSFPTSDNTILFLVSSICKTLTICLKFENNSILFWYIYYQIYYIVFHWLKTSFVYICMYVYIFSPHRVWKTRSSFSFIVYFREIETLHHNAKSSIFIPFLTLLSCITRYFSFFVDIFTHKDILHFILNSVLC